MQKWLVEGSAQDVAALRHISGSYFVVGTVLLPASPWPQNQLINIGLTPDAASTVGSTSPRPLGSATALQSHSSKSRKPICLQVYAISTVVFGTSDDNSTNTP